MKLDWNDLRYVLETTRQGGLSGAARVLGVTHATVARRIRVAEEVTGARLFDRMPQGYVPTPAGLEAVRTAETMEQATSALSRAIAARDQRLSGHLTLTAPQLLVERVLAPIFAEFRAAHPEIAISLVATNDALNLSRREADVAFRIAHDPPEMLVGTRAAQLRAAVYGNQALAEKMAAEPVPVLDWIRFAHWPGPSDAIKQRWPERRTVLTLDDMIAAIGAVRAGIGATRMACFLGDSDPQLRRLPGSPVVDYAPLWVLTHPDLRRTPRVALFMRFATERLRKMRPLFEGGDDKNV